MCLKFHSFEMEISSTSIILIFMRRYMYVFHHEINYYRKYWGIYPKKIFLLQQRITKLVKNNHRATLEHSIVICQYHTNITNIVIVFYVFINNSIANALLRDPLMTDFDVYASIWMVTFDNIIFFIWFKRRQGNLHSDLGLAKYDLLGSES